MQELIFTVNLDQGYSMKFVMSEDLVTAIVSKNKWQKVYTINDKFESNPKISKIFEYRERDEDESDEDFIVDTWLNMINEPKESGEDPIINSENLIRSIINCILAFLKKEENNEDIQYFRENPNIDE